MASKALRENPLVVLLGHPNPKDVKVSQEVENLGLNLLRAEPSSLVIHTYPDHIQPRYGDYSRIIHVFMKALELDKAIPSNSGPHSFPWTKASDNLPFDTIPLTMAWATEPPAEVIEQIRNRLTVSEGTSGGKPSIIYKPADWDLYDGIKAYKSNIRATAPIESINIKAMIAARAVLQLFSTFLKTHKYPAFIDDEHVGEFETIGWAARGPQSSPTADEMEEDDPSAHLMTAEPWAPPFAQKTLEAEARINVVHPPTKLPTSPAWVDVTTNLDDIPSGNGLWFPYFSVLAQYDTKTILRVIDRYFKFSLGDDIESCLDALRILDGDVAMFCQTEVGKQVTHLAIVIEMALDAQAQVIPLFRGKQYIGSVLRGAGFTVDCQKKAYRPGKFDELKLAIGETDISLISLREIAKIVAGGPDVTKSIIEARSFLQLRGVLLDQKYKEGDKERILKLASSVTYSQPNWTVNLDTITFALSKLRDTNFFLGTTATQFPIHHSHVLTKDTVATIWSCFGSYAPSFRVPGGREFDLSEDMEIDVVDKRGNKKKQRVVRIAVRLKTLEQAIADLKETMEKKTIVNPMVMPKVKVSQVHTDKTFEGDRGKELLAVLRDAFDIAHNVKGKGKKHGLEDGEEPARKRANKGALSTDDW